MATPVNVGLGGVAKELFLPGSMPPPKSSSRARDESSAAEENTSADARESSSKGPVAAFFVLALATTLLIAALVTSLLHTTGLVAENTQLKTHLAYAKNKLRRDAATLKKATTWKRPNTTLGFSEEVCQAQCGAPGTAPDSDGDGVPDHLDDDDDNDGIPDSEDNDDDGDGIPDSEEAVDSDGDGIPDSEDDDDDGDGIPDSEDNDDDGDGIPDSDEAVDSDGDGIPDSEDDDDDNDGIPDSEDNDDDGDGIPDSDEAVDSDGDGIPDSEDDDDDNDGIPDSEDNDDDGDGIPDSDEAVDSDGDGIPDSEDDDDDNDGIPDSEDNDDDGDGIPDSEEIDETDTDGDGVPDFLDDDDDNDGIPDSEDDDDDGDGISDKDEEGAGDEEEGEDEVFTPIRVLVLLGLSGLCYFSHYVYSKIDELPPYLHRRAESVVGTTPYPLSKQIAYNIDCWFSSNPYAKVLALLYVSIALIVGGAGFMFAVSAAPFGDAMWEALAGVGIDWTFAGETENDWMNISGFSTRVVAIMTSLGGMFITALLLGIVGDAIAEYIDDLKKGKSDVLESGHTLILGWSDKLLPILDQVSQANESEGGGCIVVLADKDKEEQEGIIDDFGYDDRGTRVICRQGNPLLVNDLRKVSASKAKAIVVLADESASPDEADARCLRMVLSLIGLRDHKNEDGEREGLEGHIVVEMMDMDNQPLVKMVGQDDVETLVAHDVIGRLMIQCARQPGLAAVWNALLGFEGCEFYCKEWEGLHGKPFGEALLSFPNALPIGYKCGITGSCFLNPKDDYVLQVGDELIVIAEDDDSYELEDIAQCKQSLGLPPKKGDRQKETVLFCGWRRDMDDLVQVLDELVLEGSELYILCELPEADREERFAESRIARKKPPNLTNLKVIHVEGDLCSRRVIESLPLAEFNSIVILADEESSSDITDKDSRALATLLLIRNIQTEMLKESGSRSPPMRTESGTIIPARRKSVWAEEMRNMTKECVVISEILDSRTRQLIQETGISDYVLSNELVSMALAMVSENKSVNTILNEMFQEEGSELYLRPASLYMHENEEASFFDVMARARERENPEIIIGYQLEGEEVVLNPEEKTEPRIWTSGDFLVVLAEDE